MCKDIEVSLVSDEMVTRAYAVFLKGVTAITPKHDNGRISDEDRPPAVMRRALEAALHGPDIDGAVADLRRDDAGNVIARLR